uniref:Uncharacterized protein n=1 Tax=Steinernema glaseri TaxID=37863 RepID=A0A1I7ZQ75_9BILA
MSVAPSTSPPRYKIMGKEISSNVVKWSIAVAMGVPMAVASILLGIGTIYISSMIEAIGLQKDTSKPCDPNAYLDKAQILHQSHVWEFHRELRAGKNPSVLGELVEEAQDIQRKLSESEDDEYRNDLALRMVYFALAEKSCTEVTPAIERYMKSINMDRVLVMEKFLIGYLSDVNAEENAVARLNAALVPFDLKVAQLKSAVPSGYHEFIESYWGELKQATTPGLMEACLPENYNAEGLVKKYKLTACVSGCVPNSVFLKDSWRFFCLVDYHA